MQQQRIILPQHPLPQQILMQQVASPMTSLQHSTNQVPSYKQDVITSYVSTNQGAVFSNQPMTSQIVSTNGMQQYIISSTQSPIYTVSTSQANPRQELIYATAGNNELMQQQTGFETRQHGAADNVSVAQMISQGQLNPSSHQVISQHGHQLQLSRASNVSSVSSPLAGLVQIEVPLPLPEEALANEVAFEAEEDVKEEQADSNLHFVDENIGIDPNIVYSTANLQDETNIQQEQIIHLPFPQSLSDMQSSVHFEPSHHESFEPPEQLLDEDMDDNLEQETFLPNEEATNIENVEMYASENETGDVNEPMEDNNQEDYHSNDEGDREMKTRESLPTPTRSTLPGMIIPSGLMSLSSAANIFRAESISSKSSSRLVLHL